MHFTLDMNCLIDLDEHRSSEAAIRKIVASHTPGSSSTVAVLGIGASERQRDHGYLQTADAYYERLAQLGLDHLKVLLPMAILDMTFFDNALLIDRSMSRLDFDIHTILFPDTEYAYEMYCKTRGLPNGLPLDSGYRNRRCDTQAMWCHVFSNRDVFVTSDNNFIKKAAALKQLGAGKILKPSDAAALLP